VNTVLTIDFDFFVQAPFMDLGFREAPFFINDMWEIRKVGSPDIENAIKISEHDPRPDAFARRIVENCDIGTVYICESHFNAYNEFRKIKDLHVINVDAHHDVGYSGGRTVDYIDCSNWAHALSPKKYTLIYPKWRRELDEIEWRDDIEVDFDMDIHYGLEFIDDELTSFPHLLLCRSGAWSPPWLDDEFMKMALILASNAEQSMVLDYDSLDDFKRRSDPVKSV